MSRANYDQRLYGKTFQNQMLSIVTTDGRIQRKNVALAKEILTEQGMLYEVEVLDQFIEDNAGKKQKSTVRLNNILGRAATGRVERLFANAGIDIVEEVERMNLNINEVLESGNWYGNYFSDGVHVYKFKFNYDNTAGLHQVMDLAHDWEAQDAYAHIMGAYDEY